MPPCKRPPGERVVVYDCEGYFVAAGIAELLALEGHRVDPRRASIRSHRSPIRRWRARCFAVACTTSVCGCTEA